MRWRAKETSIYDIIKHKFALIPRLVNDEWFWLESYWEVRYFLPYGEVAKRFKTKEEAEGWVWKNNNDLN